MRFHAYIAASLDGFIAREDGSLDWLPGPDQAPEGEDYGFKEFMDSVDALVMGRNTFDFVLTSESWLYGNKPVYVLTSRDVEIPERLTGKAFVHSAPLNALLRKLEKDGIAHVYVDGGKTIQSFLNAGLLNTITITRIPVLIGSGIPLFGALKKDIWLRHLETRAYENGMVQSRYAVVS